jgi:hypothetical protein
MESEKTSARALYKNLEKKFYHHIRPTVKSVRSHGFMEMRAHLPL